MGTTHAEALRRVRGVEVLGIQGSTPEKSSKAAEALELPKAYASFEELIADDEVEAVHITTPNRLHFEQAAAALRAGKHVMCEKPLAMTSDETRELVALSRESGLGAGVNYNLRFYPINFEAKERIESGSVGQVFSVFGSYQQDWLLHDTDYNWRVLAEEQGELRAVADIGTHWIDLIRHITGLRPEAVFAETHTVHPVRKRPEGEVETYSGKLDDQSGSTPVSIRTDDVAALVFRFDGGARGSLFVSQTSAGRKNSLRYEIYGSKSSIWFGSEEPNAIVLGHRDQANEVLFKDPGLNGDSARRFTDYPGGHAEGFPDTFKMCFRAFYEHIAAGLPEGEATYATFEDGHEEVVMCDAILKSREEGKWINL